MKVDVSEVQPPDGEETSWRRAQADQEERQRHFQEGNLEMEEDLR